MGSHRIKEGFNAIITALSLSGWVSSFGNALEVVKRVRLLSGQVVEVQHEQVARVIGLREWVCKESKK